MAGGRPTKLTPETQRRIIEAIGLGSTYELACNYAGISYRAFNDWMNAGAAAKSGAFAQFFHAVKAAEGAAAVGWLTKIEQAATDGTWQAAAWKLERRYPKEYGRSVTTVQGDPDQPLVMSIAELYALANRPPDASAGGKDPCAH